MQVRKLKNQGLILGTTIIASIQGYKSNIRAKKKVWADKQYFTIGKHIGGKILQRAGQQIA